VLVWCDTLIHVEGTVENHRAPSRRVVQLDSGDEVREVLAGRGIYFLQADIDECSTYAFCVDVINSQLQGHFKDRPMTVVLNTPGGEVEHGLAIYDTIRMLVEGGTEVHVVGLGLVASMGTVIMQAGTRRVATPNTQFLVHQLSMTIGYFKSEEVNQLKDRAGEAERLNNVVMGIIAKRSGIDLEDLKNRCSKKDLWMDSAGAMKLGTNGLIDEISVLPDALKLAFKEV